MPVQARRAERISLLTHPLCGAIVLADDVRATHWAVKMDLRSWRHSVDVASLTLRCCALRKLCHGFLVRRQDLPTPLTPALPPAQAPSTLNA